MSDQKSQAKQSHIHLLGIGGAGMSAIATVLLQQGYTVSGSDRQTSPATDRLQHLGATVYIGHHPENLADSVTAMVVSSAIPADNPEVQAARARNVPLFKRAEWLGQMMSGKTGIALAGTHGKTTTTAMTAFILQEAGLHPTFIIGGFVPQMETNAAAGIGTAFVIEADEYDHTFLGLRPHVAVITIAEWDHPDIFATPQALQQAFQDFVRLVPPDGLTVGCGDAVGVAAVLAAACSPTLTYGLEPYNDWQAVNLTINEHGGCQFQIRQNQLSQILPVTVSLAAPGLHNLYNALAALIVAQQQGVELADAAQILGRFTGVDRRFEQKGQVNNIIVVDDYAHHPTEIKAALAAARAKFGNRPIWAVFQPHTFSRTLALLDDFAAAFADADHVIIVDIFPSREVDDGRVSSRDIVARMHHPDVRYIDTREAAADFLATHLSPPALLLTMGAGNGDEIGEWVLARLQQTVAAG